MIKAIIFDFDGVIVESVDIKTKSFAKLFKPYGRNIVKKVISYHIKNSGVSRFEKIKYIYKNILKRKLLKNDFNNLCKQFSNLVFDEIVRAKFVKGAKEFIVNNFKKYNFYICSATPQSEINNIVDRIGINKYFKKIYGSPLKKITIVKKIISLNKLERNSIVYIGDSISDYNASKSNSINFIARIYKNNRLFSLIKCIKIKSLANLDSTLKIFEYEY